MRQQSALAAQSLQQRVERHTTQPATMSANSAVGRSSLAVAAARAPAELS